MEGMGEAPGSTDPRMLACHNFVSQDVFTTEDKDIVSMCAAGDKLLIATSRMNVEVRDLNSKGQLLMAFPTTDQALSIVYCEGANFVLTLEKEMSRSVDMFHVRAYFNWWVEPCNQVPKTRDAGSQPAASNGATDSRLEIVELPSKRPAVSCIGCCRQSGTSVVASGSSVSVFVLRNRYDVARKQSYNDFELLLVLKVSFHPNSLHVCEDHVACCSSSELLILKICLKTEADNLVATAEDVPVKQKKKQPPANTHDSSSPVVDDPHYVELKFDSANSVEWANASWEQEWKAVLHPSCFPVQLTLKSVEEASADDVDVVILGPRVNPPDVCNVLVTVSPDTDLISSIDEVSAVVLLYRKFCSKAKRHLKAFHWVPYYVNDGKGASMLDPLTEAISAPLETAASILHSRVFSKLKTLACLVSSETHGYFYTLSGVSQLLSIYTYSKEAESVAIDTCFLHALTSAGLETYTVPVPCELPEAAETSKDAFGKPIVMVGLRPFLGIKSLLMADQHLVLAAASGVSSGEASEPSCTLYSLLKPAINRFFYDLEEAASKGRKEDELSYANAIKGGLRLLKVCISSHGKYSCSSELLATYADACCILGDIFLKSDAATEKDHAASYYALSDEHMETVVNRILFFKGLVSYTILTKVIVQYVKLVCSQPPLSARKPVPPSVADTVLEIFSEECPEYMHKLVLCSGIAAFSSDKALTRLRKRLANRRQSQGYAADSLAVAHLLLQAQNADMAQNLLKTVSKEFLTPVLLDLHELIHSDQCLTQLGQLVKLTRPDAYFSMLVHLKNAGTMSPEQVVLLLQHASPGSEPHSVPLLREFLEAILSSKRTNAQAYPHLLMMLVKVYMGKLAPYSGSGSPQQTPSQLVHTKPTTLFGNRPAWLLELPPFFGRAVTKTCDQYSTTLNLAECCACSSCWDELLRMQSLLCSDLLSASLRFQVLELLEKSSLAESDNYVSLKVLCLPPGQARSLLLKSYPSAVLGFMESKFPEDSAEWASLYTDVSGKLQACKKRKGSIYHHISEAALSYLSEVLTPVELLDLLPPGKQEHVEHVKHCMERYQAKLLREKIIALGTELKEMM